MKFDKAYCIELDESVTIYEVRDLHFDESEEFDANSATFLCPDEECREEETPILTTFNATTRTYIKTPHFKDKPSTVHRGECPYSSEAKDKDNKFPSSTHLEHYKETHFPSEFLLNRRSYPRKAGQKDNKEKKEKEAKTISTINSNTAKASRGTSLNRTSVFEHIIECYLANIDNKKLLRSMPLKIDGLKLNYYSFFKNVRFFEDGEGLIYCGKVKQVKKYGQNYRIDYCEKVKKGDEYLGINIYIKQAAIEEYRKKSIFMEAIEELVKNSGNQLCFFVGVYPQLKKIIQKNSGTTFHAYSVELENLDNIHFRTTETNIR